MCPAPIDPTARARLELLLQNELDLQIELRDLAEEVESRQVRIAEVRAALRETREEIARLTREDES